MPFDSMPESVRIRYVAAARGLGGRIRAYETWRDCHPDDLAQTLAYIRRFDRARRIMTEPAPPPRQIGEWRFTDMAGNVSGWSDYWTGKPPAPTKVDCYGMTAETRRQHRAADHPGLEARAVQYAMWLAGHEAPHSSKVKFDGAWIGKIEETGHVTNSNGAKEKRAVCVHLHATRQSMEIPNWDYVERGALS